MKKLYALCAALLCASLLQAQTISITSLSPSGPYCSNAAASLVYTVSANFAAAQDFKVEISDASGAFAATPPVIGSRDNEVDGGSISVTMPSVLVPGSGYLVRVSAYAHGTSTLSTSTTIATAFTINPLPLPTLSADVSSVCQNGQVVYTTEAGQSSYVWAFPLLTAGTDYTLVSGGTGSDNTATVKWLSTGAKSVSINYTSAGCTIPTPTIQAVTVNALPTVSFTAAPADACMGAPVTYTTQIGQTAYDWQFPGSTLGTDYTLAAGTGNSTSNTATVTWLTSGAKSVTVNYQDGNGCSAASATATATTVHTLPIATFTAAPGAPICANTTVTYTTQAGMAAGSYTWTIPGAAGTNYDLISGGGVNDNMAEVKWKTPGNQTVEVNYTDGNGCAPAANASNTVEVKPLVATPNFGVLGTTSERCQGSGTLNYPAIALNNTGITYSIDATSSGAGNSIDPGTGALTYDAAWNGATIITASAAGCGGPKTATHTVTVKPLVGTPSFSLGASTTRCQGAGTVAYTAAAANNTGLTYSLDAASLGAGNTIDPSNGSVDYAAGYSGTATITVNAAGCSPKSASHTVTIVGYPAFAMGASSTRCQAFGTITYTATATNASSISYALDGASSGAGNVINTATGQVTYSNAYSGTSIITATATGCGTPLQSTHAVTINPSVGPVSFVGASPIACQGSSVTYIASADNDSSISFSLDSAGLAAGNTINAGSGEVHFEPGFTGSATITATAKGCGVTTTATHTVVIKPVVTQPVFNVGPLDTICQNSGNIAYTATAANTTAPMSYSLSPAAAGSIGGATGIVSYNASFTGAATITTTATGCNGTTTKDFHVFVVPTVAAPVFAPGSLTVRKQGAGIDNFAATATAARSISYSMTPAAAGNIIANSGVVTWNPTFSGTDTIIATATGCNASPSTHHIVVVVQTPVFDSGLTSARCQGAGNRPYIARSSNGAVSYSLQTIPNDPSTTINSGTGLVSFSAGFYGTAIVSAVATNGAVITDTAQHIITVNKAPSLTAPTPSEKTICSGDSTRIPLVATSGAGSTFTWTTSGGAFISGKSGDVLNNINQALVNSSGVFADSVEYIVTVTSAAACTSLTPDIIKVRVNPKPVLSPLLPRTICSQDTINFSLNASTPSTFVYSERHDANIRNAFGSGGNSISQTLENTDSSASPATGAVTYRIVPTSLDGCVGNADSVTVQVKPAPRVIFSTGPAVARCSGASSAISLTANVASSFSWTTASITSKNFVTGNAPGSGNSINQTLSNSSNSLSDSIIYTVKPTTISSSPTCVGPEKTVVVTVNPKPVLTSRLTDSVCSNSSTATALSASLPSTYSWTIGANNGGIGGATPQPISTALSAISQKLVNPSFVNAGSIDYVVTPASTVLGNCVGDASTVTITVNPQPKLTSPAAAAICSDTRLNYVPTSSVAIGITTFTYDRTAQVPSIPNQFQRITTAINDSLSSHYQLDPAMVDYNFSLKSDAGCVLSDQHLSVTVNPTPDTPGISIFPETKLCSGALNMNFSSSRQPDPREYFRWRTVNGGTPIQKADSSFSQNALISFPGAGNADVIVESSSRGYGCKGKPSRKTFVVSNPTGAQDVNVVLFASNLVAQVSSAQTYQWGFDRRLDLDSTLLGGETTQSYDTRKGFNTDVNQYWVMVGFGDGCVQKAYFNAPVLSVATQAGKEALEMKLYPNPAQETLTVELPEKTSGTLRFEILDLAGRRVTSADAHGRQTRIPVGKLAPGYYNIVCLQDGARVAASRFIKN